MAFEYIRLKYFHPQICIVILLVSSNYLKLATDALPPIAQQKIRCDEAEGTCYCPEDPITLRYPDDSDPTCQHYYICHMGRAFKRKCDVRTTFHPQKSECLPRERVPESICKLPVNCPPFINRYVEDPDDCTKYYLCFYQRPLLYGCPESNYFDPEKEKCTYNNQVAEECLRLADAKRGGGTHLNATYFNPEKTSLALSQARARIAESKLTSSSTSSKDSSSKSKSNSDWAAFAYPLGKFLHGSSS